MENSLPDALIPFQCIVGGLWTVFALALLSAKYYKDRYLAPRLRLTVVSPNEQRRMIRVANYSVLELGDEKAHLVNISLGGVCFASTLPLNSGDKVQAKLHASKEWFLNISGKIVWSKPESQQTLYGLEIQKATESRL